MLWKLLSFMLAACSVQGFVQDDAYQGQAPFSTPSTITGPPASFPKSGNGLWYASPAPIAAGAWQNNFLPIGNGYLGAMTPGGTDFEATMLNVESLWSGGPFEDPSYNGGNSPPSAQAELAADMQQIRATIFSSADGEIDNIEELASPAGAYGSYLGAGYLLTSLGQGAETPSSYARWLDLDEGIAYTQWSDENGSFSREAFCSYPARICAQRLSLSPETSSSELPLVTFAWTPLLDSSSAPDTNITCYDHATLRVRGMANGIGMLYEVLLRVYATPSSTDAEEAAIACTMTSSNATLSVASASSVWISWIGGTDYDAYAGDAAHNFSFAGTDPHASLLEYLPPLGSSDSDYASLRAEHVDDVTSLLGGFSISLGASVDVTQLPPTDQVKAAYAVDGNAGGWATWLETVLLMYGRYLLGSSGRGTLPANLQGVWAEGANSPWSADYHANINTQMNYWAAEMTAVNVTQSLWDYMQLTWAPRGAETAQILYNISQGWVTHNEMNIFGHTGMKLSGNSAQWSDYPESAVWMMVHVWDHFDYTNDIEWWVSQGWPLLKGVASFHLEKLLPDEHFHDLTLVTCPCNSPEQVPITFGCAHAQQLIWQLFNAVEKGFNSSGDTDTSFLDAIRKKREDMDKGIRIGSWGQLQEWKVDMDNPNDTHRHLSHLVGLYPGYAVASYDPTIQPVPDLLNPNTTLPYTTSDVLQAAETSLIHRGNGTGPDADAGWEKVWRAAAWAQLRNASAFYYELQYAIERNFGSNLYSLYDPTAADPIFQIDANLGYPATVMNALIQAPDTHNLSSSLAVTLLPALPSAWSSGSIIGARVRGGISVNLTWSEGQPTEVRFSYSGGSPRNVTIMHAGLELGRTTMGAPDSEWVYVV